MPVLLARKEKRIDDTYFFIVIVSIECGSGWPVCKI